MELEVFTYKADADLREALRIVAFEQKTTASAFVRALVEGNPLVAKQLQKIKDQAKNMA